MIDEFEKWGHEMTKTLFKMLREDFKKKKKSKGGKMRYILNSAVITTPGKYSYQLISIDEAKKWLAEKNFQSTIGYHETAEALTILTGVKIPVNRKLIAMKEGDEALVFRLTYRLSDPNLKGKLSPEFILKNCEIGILKKEIK